MVTQVRLNHSIALHPIHKVDNNEILPVSKCLQCVTLQVLSPRNIFVSGWHFCVSVAVFKHPYWSSCEEGCDEGFHHVGTWEPV